MASVSRQALVLAPAAVLVLVLSGCSGGSDPVPASTTAGVTTTGGPGSVEGGTTTVLVPPPSIVDGAGAALDLPGLDGQQLTCLATAVNGSVAKDSGAATGERLAAVVGDALSACVAADKLAPLIREAMRTIPPGNVLSAQQLDCVQQQIATASPPSSSTFIGGVALGTPAIIAAGAKSVDAACGTVMARG